MRKPNLQCANAYLTRDKEWLEARYFGDNLSIAKIAKLIPCDYRTIHKAFQRLEIPFKPPRKCGSCYKIFEPTLKPNGKPYLTCNQCLTWSRKSRIDYKNLK
jgi:hypothetical protein